jgi:diphthamide synthase (EF-2-diphthine--ammonia ligase)
MSKQVILSWSGGKDSALALQALRRDPTIDVLGLLTSITRDYDRISIHGVRRSLLEAQVDRLGLPLFEIELDAKCPNEAYDAAFQLAFDEVWTAFPEVSLVAFGDLFLEDVRAYRERLLAASGLTPLFPIWGQDTGGGSLRRARRVPHVRLQRARFQRAGRISRWRKGPAG